MCGRCTAVSSEAWAKLREWAALAGMGRLLFSGSVVLASLKAPVSVILLEIDVGSLNIIILRCPRHALLAYFIYSCYGFFGI